MRHLAPAFTQRNLSGSSAHVKRDDAEISAHGGQMKRADHSTGGTGHNRPDRRPGRRARMDAAPIRLHDPQVGNSGTEAQF